MAPDVGVIKLDATAAPAGDDDVMTSAMGVRIGWLDVPEHVRTGIGDILGSSVVEAHSQAGGFSPGSADRVVTENGRRAFVKAAGVCVNVDTVRMHRREAAVSAGLADTVPAPRLLGSYDDGDWVALVFEDVDGRHPRTPWLADELAQALTALQALATTPLSAAQREYPQAADALGGDLRRWRQVMAAPPVDLDPWAAAHLDLLTRRAERAIPELTGDSLVHLDVRADNLLVRPDGDVVIVDRPWAARGPSWLDALGLLVNVNLFGGHDVDALVNAHVRADREVVTGFLIGLTGFFIDAARQPNSPGLPTVRAFQAAQGRTTLEWVRRRVRL